MSVFRKMVLVRFNSCKDITSYKTLKFMIVEDNNLSGYCNQITAISSKYSFKRLFIKFSINNGRLQSERDQTKNEISKAAKNSPEMSHDKVRFQMEKGLRPTNTPEGKKVSRGNSIVQRQKGNV